MFKKQPKRSFARQPFSENGPRRRSNFKRSYFKNSKSGHGNFSRSRNNPNKAFINETLYVKKAITSIETAVYESNFQFSDLAIDNTLKQNISAKSYITPTPIQDEVITKIMAGKDILGIANTGTGKTAAFLIPLIQKVLKDKTQKVLIVTPTRELADQINDELYSLTKNLRIFSVMCIGGSSVFRQISNIRRGFNFIIGTPGRLIDLSRQKAIDYSRINNLVLDEVDRMLDMGFIQPVKQIVSLLPQQKQTSFFSATTNSKVEELIREVMHKEYDKVSVKHSDTALNIEQNIIKYFGYTDKLTKLEDILRSEQTKKTLVFVSTKRYTDMLEKTLKIKGYKVSAIHGNKRQNERKRSITYFKTGVVNVLVATDVAARGLDINGITHVINYDEPNNFDDYVHRIGRTGRGDKAGVALTFVPRKISDNL